MPEQIKFASKLINYTGVQKRIVCQNENGPCPLLAVCNALILRGDLTLPSGETCVESSVLQALLVGHLLDSSGQDDGQGETRHYQIDETIQLVEQGRFVEGLDVNPIFGGPEAYEFTRELGVFDISRLRLLHGWVVHPAGEDGRLLGGLSYNDASLAVVTSLEDGAVLRSVTRSLSGSMQRAARRCERRSRPLCRSIWQCLSPILTVHVPLHHDHRFCPFALTVMVYSGHTCAHVQLLRSAKLASAFVRS